MTLPAWWFYGMIATATAAGVVIVWATIAGALMEKRMRAPAERDKP